MRDSSCWDRGGKLTNITCVCPSLFTSSSDPFSIPSAFHCSIGLAYFQLPVFFSRHLPVNGRKIKREICGNILVSAGKGTSWFMQVHVQVCACASVGSWCVCVCVPCTAYLCGVVQVPYACVYFMHFMRIMISSQTNKQNTLSAPNSA